MALPLKKGVVVEEYGAQGSGVGERRWDGAEEAVHMEVEAAEEGERVELGWEVPSQVLARDGQAGDALNGSMSLADHADSTHNGSPVTTDLNDSSASPSADNKNQCQQQHSK
jgi:hypothetical protein